MSFLKSVIADAYPAKSMQRSDKGLSTVSGQMPGGLTRYQSQADHTDSTSHRQTTSHRPSDLSNITDNHHAQVKTPAKIQTQTKIKTSQVKRPHIESNHSLSNHSIKSDKPIPETRAVHRVENIPVTTSKTPGLARNVTVDKTPSVKVTNHHQAATVKPSISLQTPVETTANEQPFDSLDAGISLLSDNDEKVTPSESNENQLMPQSYVGKSFQEDITSQQAILNQDNEPEKLDQNETPHVKTTPYPDDSTNDSQPVDNTPVSPAINSTQSKTDTSSAVEDHLPTIDNQIQQQQKESEPPIEVMAVRTTSIIDDQFASQQVESPRSASPAQITQASAEVRIGQVDVFIEKPVSTPAAVSSSVRPSISMASRLYLRRL